MNEEIQKKYMQMQMMQQQIQQMHKQLEQLQEQKASLRASIMSIEELQNSKEEREILTPVSQGVFVKSKVNAVKEVLVNVGEGIVVTKKTEDAIKLVQDQVDEIDKMSEDFVNKMNENLRNVSEIEGELKESMQKEEKK